MQENVQRAQVSLGRLRQLGAPPGPAALAQEPFPVTQLGHFPQ